MNLRNIQAWFLTKAGKQFTYLATGTVTVGVLFGTFLPHTVLLEQYKDFVRLYNHGLSVPLPKKLQDRFEKAFDLLKTESCIKKLYKPFHVYGFDVFSAGSSYSRFGCIVGIPKNFSYDNIDDIDKSKVKVGQKSVAWDTEEGQQLLNSLILSENAQLYALAREISYRQTPKPMLDCFIAVNSCLITYGLCQYLNQRFNYYVKPVGFRLVLYTLVGIFSFGLYATTKDLTQIYFEEKIDTELKESNEVFATGGREFYEKLLDRNKALRKLLGSDGESLYSILGNDNYFLRTKHIPIVQRKSFFDKNYSKQSS